MNSYLELALMIIFAALAAPLLAIFFFWYTYFIWGKMVQWEKYREKASGEDW